MSASARTVLNPTTADLTKRNLMVTPSGEGAKLKLAKIRVDNLGYVKSHSGIMNDPVQLAALHNQLHLARSFASISEHEKCEAQKKKGGAKHELLNLAQIAKQNLANKSGDVSKITKKYICSLLLACYGKEVE